MTGVEAAPALKSVSAEARFQGIRLSAAMQPRKIRPLPHKNDRAVCQAFRNAHLLEPSFRVVRSGAPTKNATVDGTMLSMRSFL